MTRSFGLSEIVLTLGAEDALWGTQTEVGCQCVDLSHMIQWARWWVLEPNRHRWPDMGVPLDSGIEAAVHGVEAHLIAEKAQTRADHFNPQDHVYSFLGQAWGFPCWILASRHNHKLHCLLWDHEETSLSNPEQKARHANSRTRVASWQCSAAHRCSNSSPHHVIWLGTIWSPLPPNSPDLAPSHFHLFLHLKKFLAGQHFLNDDDVKEAMKKWLSSQAATFYEEGIQKLVLCFDKCLNNGGNYVGK